MSEKKTNAAREIGRLCFSGVEGYIIVNHAILKEKECSMQRHINVGNDYELGQSSVEGIYSTFAHRAARAHSRWTMHLGQAHGFAANAG